MSAAAATIDAPAGRVEPTLPATILRMSYEEFLDWLDEDKHAEWVDGEVLIQGPVSLRHNRVGRLLIAMIQTFSEDGNLGELAYEPFQMKTGPDLPSRAPDVLFVARANIARVKSNLLEGPADLVIEIVSPESRGRDRGDKFYEFEQGGVREDWLRDPERVQAEFYQLGADGRYTHAAIDAGGYFHSDVLRGFRRRVDWLWQDESPSVRDVLKTMEI